MSSVRISKLNELTLATYDDFFPLVDSASLTTYRINLENLAKLLSTGSFSGSFFGELIPEIISCSWASSSINSYSSIYSTSASWASSSLTSSTANSVNITGTDYNFPYWLAGTNSNLAQTSPMILSSSTVVTVYSAGAADAQTQQYTLLDSPGVGGIYSPWPITSDSFIGCDKRSWYFSTGSQYYSGSYEYATIPSVYAGLGQTLNGKWLRIAALNVIQPLTDPEPTYSCSFARTWTFRVGGGYGRVRVLAYLPTSGSSTHQLIDFVPFMVFPGNCAQGIILHSNNYQNVIQNIRLHSAARTDENGNLVFNDPRLLIDLYINDIIDNANELTIAVESYGNIKFVDTPTLDPHSLIDTGSNNSQTTIMNIDPGFYTNISDKNFILSGHKLGVGPSQSYQNSEPNYTIEVSGSISAQDYSVGSIAGVDSQISVLDLSTGQTANITSSKGIVTDVIFNGPSSPIGPALSRAYGTVVMISASNSNTLNCINSYNIQSIKMSPSNIVYQQSGQGIDNGTGSLLLAWGRSYIITFINPMPSINYNVMYSSLGYEPGAGGSPEAIYSIYNPYGQRSTTGFTMSWAGNDDNSLGEAKYITSFTVFHP